MNVEILYEDQWIVVVVKPPGMPSQGDKSSTMDLVSYLKNYLVKEQGQKAPYIAVVHRLDRPVGGVMVYAKTPEAAKKLSQQISQGAMNKKYRAVLTGRLPKPEGRLEDYLVKNGKTNCSQCVQPGNPEAKKAILEYKVIEEKQVENMEAPLTFVEVTLLTGRHHQIRVQMANAGAGIYGDTKYNPLFQNKEGWHPIGLFSTSLEFAHPKTGKLMTFTAKPLGEPFLFK